MLKNEGDPMKQDSGRNNVFQLTIKNLGCASCAAKMETDIRKLPGVTAADIDFATSRLRLVSEVDSDRRQLIAQVDGIVHAIERDACVLADQPDRQSWHQSIPWPRVIRLAAGLPVFILAWLIRDGRLFPAAPSWEFLILFIIAWLIFGYDVLIEAITKLVRRQWFDENFLMSAATLGALAIGEYPEAVAVMLFYQIGEICQQLAVDHSRRSIRALLDIRPEQAWLMTLQGTVAADPRSINIGDRIIVRPGERIPLDGRIIEGESALDTAALTGESLPKAVAPGDEALAGCINGSGLLTLEVIRPFEESAVSRILHLVEEASGRKAVAEQFITRFAAVYTPVMVGLAFLIAVLPPLILGVPFAGWIARALILLVISCPCALVLSVPLGYFAGLGAASARGILVKGGTYLEKLATVKSAVFDKTGTLTEGRFTVNEIDARGGWEQQDILRLAALAESHSSHPIAESILRAWQELDLGDLDQAVIENYQDLPGRGVKMTLSQQAVLLGNERLMYDFGVDLKQDSKNVVHDGTVLYLAVASSLNDYYSLAGMVHLADRLKNSTVPSIARLKELGISRLVLLSGDRRDAVQKIAKLTGISEVYAEMLPGQKVAALESVIDSQNGQGSVIYIGDGINDAPVLARADVGIALGAGSDAAIESADIVILGDDLAKLPEAIQLAKRTGRIIRQNVALALGLKALVLILAIAGAAGIWQAVFADVGVAVLAVFNSLRIIWQPKPLFMRP